MVDKKPIIRFKGFSENWELHKLLGVIDKVIDFRGRTPKKLGMDWSDSGYLALSALNVKNGYIDSSIEAHYGNQELYDKWMTGNELHKGQVLFTMEAPMGNVVQIPDNKKYILSQRTIAFEVKSELITESFLAVFLNSPEIFYKLTVISSGGTAKGVSQKSLSKVDALISGNLNEQSKIGEFFKNLDNLIVLNQRKYDKLVNIKKYFLNKMFPKYGADTPEIRFKGFTEDWEKRKLGEMFNYERPDNYIVESVKYSDKYLTPVLTANKGYIIGYTQEKRTYNNPSIIFDDFTLDCKYVNFPYMVKSSAIKILTIKDEFRDSLEFGFKLLNATKIEVMGHTRHYIASVQPTQVFTPNKKEQTKIGEFFKNLDNLISLRGRELEKLKNIKKAFLQKMFI